MLGIHFGTYQPFVLASVPGRLIPSNPDLVIPTQKCTSVIFYLVWCDHLLFYFFCLLLAYTDTQRLTRQNITVFACRRRYLRASCGFPLKSFPISLLHSNRKFGSSCQLLINIAFNYNWIESVVFSQESQASLLEFQVYTTTISKSVVVWMKNVFHRLMYLTIWSPADNAVWYFYGT